MPSFTADLFFLIILSLTWKQVYCGQVSVNTRVHARYQTVECSQFQAEITFKKQIHNITQQQYHSEQEANVRTWDEPVRGHVHVYACMETGDHAEKHALLQAET